MPDLDFLIFEIDEGMRLDVFLTRHEPELSRSRLKKMIDEGLVLVNGKGVKAGYGLRRGDRVVLRKTEPQKLDVLAQEIPLDILFEDESIIVINKPAGMVVHPAAGNYEGTLVNAILFHSKDLSGIGGVMRPGIVHRLDKDTSGLMVVAKSDMAHRELAKQFRDHRVIKVYQAFVFGNPREDEGIIDSAVGRHPVDRKKMSVFSRRGKEALTRWLVEERYGFLSFLELKIETGRTHQIRVHLNSIGNPVLGDNLYGNSSKRLQTVQDTAVRARLKIIKRQALHSGGLTFFHPRTGEAMEFAVSLPRDMEDLKVFLNDYMRKKFKD